MAVINLRNYYPCYRQDCMLEVSEELAAQLKAWEREERSFLRRRERHRAGYSLDRNDGLEQAAVEKTHSPEEVYEQKQTVKQINAALSILSEKQAKRIYAHCVMGICQSKIAQMEGVSPKAINYSILRGLRRMERYLKKTFGAATRIM